MTGGQDVTNPAQLAMITAATTLLSGAAAGLLGQNVYGATAAAQNETLNNACAHACGFLAAAGAIVGGAVAAGGSLAGDVATGGLNVPLTPAEVAAGSAVGATIGGTVGSKIDDWWAAHGGPLFNSGNEADTASAGEAATGADASAGNTNPYKGPVDNPVIVVDQYGNAIPVNPGEKVNSSPNGDYQQVNDNNGPTGVRLDRGGHQNQKDPAAQGPHGHVPGVTTPDGNPHLPINH